MKRGKMPSKKAILEHWSERLEVLGKHPDQLSSRDWDGSLCFACGKGDTQRAHIKAHQEGGNENPENLHVLCKGCHSDSEMLDGPPYWRWFENKQWRTIQDHAAAKSGFANFSQMWIKLLSILGVQVKTFRKEELQDIFGSEFQFTIKEGQELAFMFGLGIEEESLKAAYERHSRDDVRRLFLEHGIPERYAEAVHDGLVKAFKKSTTIGG